MSTGGQPRSGRLAGRVRELLGDARHARDAGDFDELRALAAAVIALDPGNSEAERLLTGSAERRQMTLMFCDVVGSTAMADHLDPEEVGAILRESREACTSVIERFGGFIEDHQGDGMLVRFGFPKVHEDDARRAVLSGLEILRDVGRCAETVRERHGVELQMRVAVHTDLVLLDGGIVTGSAPNEASRLQSLAEPGTLVISDATHALVKDDFDVEPMGPVELRGVSRRVELYTVLRERAPAPREPSTPFAGREDELARIAELWRSGPHAVLVTGGAGIGKSRLVREAAAAAGARCVECRCSGFHEDTSLFAFAPLLEQACGIAAGDDAATRTAKLRERVGAGPDMPFLAAALRLPAPAEGAPADVDPQRLRELAIATAAGLVVDHLTGSRAVLFVDDLHWADQSSLDLVSALLRWPRPEVVIALAAREDFAAPWPERAVPRLRLGALGADDLGRLAASMPAGAGLSPERREELIARSDGVPLYLEELVRTARAVDEGRALHRSVHQADYAIPPALRDPLLARLGAPGVDLGLAQLAATIGRDVDRRLLQELSGIGDEFDARVDALVAAGIVDPAGPGTVRFRHELIREVAYETQRLSARPERHSVVADHLLAERGPGRRADAGGAAFHLERAQRHDEAIHAHVTAAQQAQELGAHTEATGRLGRALAVTERLPAGEPRRQSELLVRQLRSFSAVMAGGYAAPEAAEDHARCVELCEELGLGPELVPSLIRSWSYYAFRGDLDAADRAMETIEDALRGGGLAFPLAFIGRGLVEFFRGQFGEARRLMELFVGHNWGRTMLRPRSTWQLPNDPLACVTAHLVPTLWIAGEREAADEMAVQALQRAEALTFPYGPFSTGYVHSLLAITRRLDGDHAGAARHARAMIAVGERHGFVLWSMAGSIQAAISAIHAGDHAQLGALVAGVAAWRDVLVAEVWTPYWLAELAGAQRAAGRPDDALRSVDEALEVAARTGSEFHTAETLRLRGELRLESGDRGGLDDLRAALDRARSQDAVVYELRAAIALARAGGERPATREALEAAMRRLPRDAHPHELDEARALAAP